MRMDKTVFQKLSVEEADDHQKDYDRMTIAEQAEAFKTIMAAAYCFKGEDWPKMDKTVFTVRRPR